MHLGADLVLETVKQLEAREINPKKQQEDTHLKPAHKLHRETCELDWDLPMHQVYNKIRGLSPFPTAWTTLYNGEEEHFLKIYGASVENSPHNEKAGTVIVNKNELKIAVEDGYVKLLEIQLPGKRRMEAKEMLNGLKLKKNAYVR
jgi:methionyl-tRNA formyltransferase